MKKNLFLLVLCVVAIVAVAGCNSANPTAPAPSSVSWAEFQPAWTPAPSSVSRAEFRPVVDGNQIIISIPVPIAQQFMLGEGKGGGKGEPWGWWLIDANGVRFSVEADTDWVLRFAIPVPSAEMIYRISATLMDANGKFVSTTHLKASGPYAVDAIRYGFRFVPPSEAKPIT